MGFVNMGLRVGGGLFLVGAAALVACGPARFRAPHAASNDRPVVDAFELVDEAHRVRAAGLRTEPMIARYTSLLREACEVGDAVAACLELAAFDQEHAAIYLAHACSMQSLDACTKLHAFAIDHEHRTDVQARGDVALALRRGCAQRLVGGEASGTVCSTARADNYELVLKEGEVARRAESDDDVPIGYEPPPTSSAQIPAPPPSPSIAPTPSASSSGGPEKVPWPPR